MSVRSALIKALEDKYTITYDIVRQAYSDIKWGGRS